MEKYTSVMDSGAVNNVSPSKDLGWIPLRESEGSRRCTTYIAANGSSIKNEGEKEFTYYTDEGVPVVSTYQVAHVKKPLTSISCICDRGNNVLFTATGGIVQNSQTRKKVCFGRAGNLYTMDMWIQAPPAGAGGEAPGFTGQKE